MLRLPRPPDPRAGARARAVASARRRRRRVPRPLRRRRRSELYWLEREHLVGKRWGPWRAVAFGASVSTVPFAAAWAMTAIGASVPIAGLIGVAGLAGGVAAMMDRVHRREAVAFAIAEIAKGRLDDAEWWAKTVAPGRGARASDATLALLLRSDVAWRRGELERARRLLDDAAQIARTAPETAHPHWQLACRQAQLAAVSGDLEQARQAHRRLCEEGREGHSDAAMTARFTGLVVAFHADDLSPLPDDFEEWVDQTLELAPGPVELALLAWACDAVGDRERTSDVLARAGGCLQLHEAALRYPQLARWAGRFEPRTAYR